MVLVVPALSGLTREQTLAGLVVPGFLPASQGQLLGVPVVVAVAVILLAGRPQTVAVQELL